MWQTQKVKTKQWKHPNDVFNFIENQSGFIINYINKEHLFTLATLAKVERHNDPSDRLIIAQAITENIPLISSDRKFELYRNQKLNFIYNKK